MGIRRFVAGIVLCLIVGRVGVAAPTGNAMVEMPDGTRLSTDWYLPGVGGPQYPVVLVRTYYDKAALTDLAEAYKSLGFAFVGQDVRGRFASEGTSSGWFDDGWGANQDGAETITWVLAQPWCNGKVGTSGGSALGITQLLTAGATHDLACQCVYVGASDLYQQLAYQGGVFRKMLVEGWTTGVGEPQIAALYRAHPTYDSFWIAQNAEARAADITIPGLHIGGWFDIFQQGTINSFMTRQHNGGPGAAGAQKLIIGPWVHGIGPTAGDITYPHAVDFNIYEYELRFADHWLKGLDNGIMEKPAVRYYTVGAVGEIAAPGNEWRTAEDWPPFPTYETEFYLSQDHVLTTYPPESASAAMAYVFDPADPCPTLGGQNLILPPGPKDQRPVSSRPDVLKFATPILFEPIEIAGNVKVRLYVSSDAPDTDFTAKLVDIYPDGREMLLLDNIQRVKFRNGFEAAEPLSPGTVGVVEIDLWHISAIFNAGHRIGVQVSSSNYPRFEVNPNSGDDFPTAENLRVARNKVYMDAMLPSALILPLREANVQIARLQAANWAGALVAGLALVAAAAGVLRRRTAAKR